MVADGGRAWTEVWPGLGCCGCCRGAGSLGAPAAPGCGSYSRRGFCWAFGFASLGFGVQAFCGTPWGGGVCSAPMIIRAHVEGAPRIDHDPANATHDAFWMLSGGEATSPRSQWFACGMALLVQKHQEGPSSSSKGSGRKGVQGRTRPLLRCQREAA